MQSIYPGVKDSGNVSSIADDGTGHEIMTGKPLLTYEEWLGDAL